MDQPLKWSDSFMVGHGALDAEHCELMAAINGVCEACMAGERERLGALLKTVEQVTAAHLKHEDDVMRDIATDRGSRLDGEVKAMTKRAIDRHVAEHERNLANLRAIMSKAESEPDCGAAQICADLKQWFLDHAVKYDSHLKTIFQAI